MRVWQALPGPPLTSEAERVRDVWTLFVLLAAAVGLLVVVLVLYCVIRFRKRDDRLPRQKRHNIPVEVVYTSVPLVIVIVLFVVTAVSVRAVDRVRAGSPDVTVDVLAFQWQWQFAYPELDVTVTGTDDAQPELVLPNNSRVRFRLTAKGQRTLEGWLSRRPTRPQPVRDELLIRLLLLEPERRHEAIGRVVS